MVSPHLTRGRESHAYSSAQIVLNQIRLNARLSKRPLVLLLSLISAGLVLFLGVVIGAPQILPGIPALFGSMNGAEDSQHAHLGSLAIDVETLRGNAIAVTERQEIVVPPGASLNKLERVLPAAFKEERGTRAVTVQVEGATVTNLNTGEQAELSAVANYDGAAARWRITLHSKEEGGLGGGIYQYEVHYKVDNVLTRADGRTSLAWPVTGLVTSTLPRFSVRFIPPPELLEENVSANLQVGKLDFRDDGSWRPAGSTEWLPQKIRNPAVMNRYPKVEPRLELAFGNLEGLGENTQAILRASWLTALERAPTTQTEGQGE